MTEINTPYFTFLQYNPPFEDPHLLIKDKRTGENILLDCGDLSKIPKQDLMSVSRLFISHFHMDHFIGFGQLLRCLLCAPPSHTLHIYGPEGLSEYVSHTIASFSWNLLDNQSFSIALTEVREDKLLVFPPRVFHTIPQNAILPKITPITSATLYDAKEFHIDFLSLDHKICVLGFRLSQKPQIHFLSKSCPYKPGPWVAETKKHYFEEDSFLPITISPTITLPITQLKEYFRVSPPSHFVYLTDFLYHPDNTKLQSFVKNAEILFIESHFLEKDSALAKKNHHLCTKDIGHLCTQTHPSQLRLFHFSRRYRGQATYDTFLSEVQYWQNGNLPTQTK